MTEGSTMNGVLVAKLRTISNRRAALDRYGRYGPLIAFAVCLALVALSSAVSSNEHGRALEGESVYPPGACDGFVYTQYKYFVIALLCWAIYYMFWGLAIVCDDYFVASLEEICEALGLSPDVAGATFMAAGSSAPELFTSLMGVFAVKNDVGVGTIVGSAVFNLCCIIGGTAVFTPGVLVIDWKPITRDTIFYAISIAAMIYVLADGWVTTEEAAALVATYFLYVLTMYFNQSMMTAIDNCTGAVPKAAGDNEFDGGDDDDDEDAGPISKAVSAPLTVLMEATIPDCTKEEYKSKYITTFLSSIAWIGILSYYMVEWASKLGCLLNIHPAIMGCTLLAAGTSVPDAIGSLLVAKQGQGDMAVSNAIGSNVFDILLGLGIPWTLNGLIYGTSLKVASDNLIPLSIFLISTLAAVYLMTVLAGFKLSTPLGMFFFSLYFLFVAYSLLHQFHLIDF
jgi:K+-dependent Na+/Ca+ exchanger-like protein